MENIGAVLEFIRNTRNWVSLRKFNLQTFGAQGALKARFIEVLKNPKALFINRRGW